MNWETEPYQQEVDKVICKFCGESSHYDFCSQNCQSAYWDEMD